MVVAVFCMVTIIMEEYSERLLSSESGHSTEYLSGILGQKLNAR